MCEIKVFIENETIEETKKVIVADEIGELAKALTAYCDEQNFADDGCVGCPFRDYNDEEDVIKCMLVQMGYGRPMHWEYM